MANKSPAGSRTRKKVSSNGLTEKLTIEKSEEPPSSSQHWKLFKEDYGIVPDACVRVYRLNVENGHLYLSGIFTRSTEGDTNYRALGNFSVSYVPSP